MIVINIGSYMMNLIMPPVNSELLSMQAVSLNDASSYLIECLLSQEETSGQGLFFVLIGQCVASMHNSILFNDPSHFSLE